jgi:hypothetical protein
MSSVTIPNNTNKTMWLAIGIMQGETEAYREMGTKQSLLDVCTSSPADLANSTECAPAKAHEDQHARNTIAEKDDGGPQDGPHTHARWQHADMR